MQETARWPVCLINLYDVEVKRWLREHRLVKLHKRLGHALALPSLAAVIGYLLTFTSSLLLIHLERVEIIDFQ